MLCGYFDSIPDLCSFRDKLSAQNMVLIHSNLISDSIKHTVQDHRRWVKIIVRVVIALAILGLIAILAIVGGHWFGPAEAWIERQGIWAPVLFAGIFLLLVTCFIPEAVPSLTAGALFGLWWGWLFVIVVGFISAIVLFYLSRYVLRRPVERMMKKHPKFAAIDKATGQEGFKIMLLLRLAPIAFSPLCYGLGATRVTFKAYFLALIGMLPGNFVTVYYGTAAKHVAKLASGEEKGSTIYYVGLIVGLVAAIAAVAVVAHVARRALKNAMEASEKTSAEIPTEGS